MENVYLIVGLGNPGKEYERTRHNAGFLVVQRLAQRWEAAWSTESRLRSRMAQARSPACWLCQPLTYMNISGEAVAAVSRFYRVPLEKLLVVVDDADLDLGTLRLRPAGSSGGHHGLESIERHLSSQKFARLRVGIGRAQKQAREITGHVLGPFAPPEWALMEKVLDRACDQVACFVQTGIQAAMNRFNGTIEKKASE